MIALGLVGFIGLVSAFNVFFILDNRKVFMILKEALKEEAEK